MYFRRQSLVLVIAAATACSATEGHPPVARIIAEPQAIPERDEFQTDVVLDGSTSSDPIDDPDAARPLAYEWSFTNDDAELQPGSGAFEPIVTVRFRGARPPTIRLTVTDEDGQATTVTRQLQLTVP
jgi:hypothetical protein